MTVQTQAVLHAFLADPAIELYGLEIAERTSLMPGTTYPILVRLLAAGWITDRWENLDPHEEQRPRRRYYKLTDEGAFAAREALRSASSKGFVQSMAQWGLADGSR